MSWDGVNSFTPPLEAGYCTHASTLFPNWHRAYNALYEQMIWNYTQQIAATYPTSVRATYQEAANRFRVPYWDWALGGTDAQMPVILRQSQLDVTSPTGRKTVRNPHVAYRFNPPIGEPTFKPPFANQLYTYRDDAAQTALAANAENIRERVYLLLTQQSSYTRFSSTLVPPGDPGYNDNSLEDIHNIIHGSIGGFMRILQYSAFDPVFWLHHTNLDRLYEIWQAIWPYNSKMTPLNNKLGTYTRQPNTIEDVNSPLTPFKNEDTGTFFTSADSNWTCRFGYTVPEVLDWNYSRAGLRTQVLAKVKALYDPGNKITPRSSVDFPYGERSKSALGALLDRRQSDFIPSQLRDPKTGATRQWLVNVRVNRYAIKQSFFIHIFLGPVPQDKSQWFSSPNFVGSTCVLIDSQDSPAVISNEVNLRSQVPLTRKLVQKYNSKTPGVPDLEVGSMKKYLRDNLAWRAQRLDDMSEVPLADIKSLKVFVVNGMAKQKKSADDEDPQAGVMDLEPIPDITVGKLGGLASNALP